ncbi:MAG: phosphoenolpyruvate synthase [Gammaproteobacteria bacterium]|nr:phosphoenolpyruvate synthase [Gammaproteobacteria bacterium]NIR84168.1 phosphoenolpyruvate synthase [Gammaproteobacteria bacterium]NIR89480.1 phosphoenolpyruvate synthase [Gammaproteobacteria bacterium]NIU05323.1 phosphoenolpyruvate synthase [Gammaproteobacteria bacterium]NIV52263.1 phosphoenolpyruvate synthase [Gammaproteobacteria bacterium]
MGDLVVWFEQSGKDDVGRVGGKNASIGEMISQLSTAGVSVPKGFATTADAYRQFLAQEGLARRIKQRLASLDIEDVSALTQTGTEIRRWITELPFPPTLREAVAEAYRALEQSVGSDLSVAVRSSATAEDLPEASFAGQQETLLNIRGLDNVLLAIKDVFASLYNDRAIAYRVHHGFHDVDIALSAGVQQMVRSDLGASGVVFTLDTESGFRDVVLITAAYGLGETVVQGAVNPDEFYVHKQTLAAGRPAILRRSLGTKAIKIVYTESADYAQTTCTEEVPESEQLRFSLNDQDVEALARQAVAIEDHYGRPMDIEWAKDGADGHLYILQARPETVKSRSEGMGVERYSLKEQSRVIASGRAIGQRIGGGTARIITDLKEMARLEPGDVLITDMTDPDWEPVMKRASAIVTNRGGRTCHAAIIARELGVPAVVGTGDGTRVIPDGGDVTVSCAEGDTGYVYEGALEFDYEQLSFERMPEVPVKIGMIVGNPDRAFEFAAIPNHGVGLARLEFIINNIIGIHPNALLRLERMPPDLQKVIRRRTAGYADPVTYYVEKLAEGVATIAAAFSPKPVIVRLSDFKSNEYYNLIGGEHFEPDEDNPMIGFRGASRYLSEAFRESFDLECRAMRKVREEMGFTNVEIMVPFVRTLSEAQQVTQLLAETGLERGRHGLKLIMMCEVPSNPVLAEEFLEYFDGFSIGSNDLTQLVLGLDRNSGLVAGEFDERDPAVKRMLHRAIRACREKGKYVGICGQGPSDYPDFAEWLLEEGIESISLNPDTVVSTWLHLAGQSV